MKFLKLNKYLVVLLLLLSATSLMAQVADDFADGDFTTNPTWVGTDTKFIISSGLLKLQAPAVAETAYLSTPSNAINNASWEFFVRLDFNPSSSNHARVYLASSAVDLTAPLNGYYVMIGNTDDEISLYKQTGTTRTKIIDGLNGRVNIDPVSIKIKVTRDAGGNWELFSDVGPTGTYVSEGITNDVAHTASSYLGVQCTYTSTRSSHFWFDDFIVNETIVPDTDPPLFTGIQIVDENSLLVTYNEAVDQISVEDVNHYFIDNSIGNPTTAVLQPDNKSALLTLSNPLQNGLSYSVQVADIMDQSGNIMTIAALNFLYFIPQPVNYKDIIVSEFMADPTPVVGLPEAEFVEFYNRSSNPVSLSGWKLTDGSSVATLPNYILLPGSNCVVTSTANSTLFPGSLGVPNFPSLNNSSDNILIKNDLGFTIDSIHYTTSWYHSEEKKDGGWSIEIKDPENLCGEEDNWTSSINAQGGTPGSINSVDGNNPDTVAPKILSTHIKNSNTIEIVFDEKMDGAAPSLSSDPPIDLSWSGYSASLRQLTITSGASLQVSTPYMVTINNTKDCTGNSLAINSFEIVLPENGQPGDVLVNEVLFNPKTNGVDFVEIYNNSSKYISLKKWMVANWDGLTKTNVKTLSSAILPPREYRYITSDSAIIKIQYPNALNDNCIISLLPPLPDNEGSIALTDSLGTIIDFFSYKETYHLTTLFNKEGVSLERISSTKPSNDPENWRSASSGEGNATPGYKNSASYPFLTSVLIQDSKTLLVSFSSPLESSSAQALSSYLVDEGIGNPSLIQLQNEDTDVLLTFPQEFVNGHSYVLTISGLKDPDNKSLSIETSKFLYFIPSPVAFKDVIVSEFMADPTPVVGLPEAEFVELHNRSASPINLSGWKLTDGSSVAALPNYILLPHSNCVVTSTANSILFPGSLGVPNFPSLNNSSDNIIIESEQGITIDSIHYTTSWYHSEEKKDGGWSIEIIDPENSCGEETNWTSSVSAQGGTPGLGNSVNDNNPDTVAPKILSTQIKNSNTVEIVFDEKMDGASPSVMSSPLLDFNSVVYSASLRQLTITSSTSFLISTPYTVTINNAKDCTGNSLINGPFQFVLPEPAQPGDILVNEILFNPKTNGVDFVEIYNNTSKYVSLKKWMIANYDGTTKTNAKTLSTIILPPHEYRFVTTDSANIKTQYPKAAKSRAVISSLPPLPDSEGSVALVDSLGSIIDYLNYNENNHLSMLASKEGVSLERISFTEASNNPVNWRSASVDEDYATPGYKNSASYPFLVNGLTKDSKTILISFSSSLEQSSAQSPIGYKLDHGNENPSSVQLQNGNKDVLLTFSQEFVNGFNYVLTIAGLKDPDGELLSSSSFSFLYFTPTPVKYKDIVVTEFMTDPTPVMGLPEAEFVELFNRSSNPVNLLGWKLSDGFTVASLPQYILLPASRCVVTTKSASGLFSGSIGIPGFPSLNNDGDNIILKNPNGATIDSILYSLSWYHSDEKKDGGWSLEIIDPENLCGEENNWTASENTSGGTPGFQNSVLANNLDLTAPLIQTCVVTSASSLEILFNEKMNGAVAPDAFLTPPISISSVEFDKTLRKLSMYTNEEMSESVPYTLYISNAFDCSGNILENNSYQFLLPTDAKPGDISINEILFNPKSGGVDFVEIYNRSNKYLSLKNWKLSNYEDAMVKNPKEIKMLNPIISPNSFVTFTSDAAVLKSHYPRAIEETLVNTFLPSLPDDEGAIALVDGSGNVMDAFFYMDDYHTAFIKDTEGVSLERISLDAETNNAVNWRSASQFENFATPGYKNSASSNASGIIAGEMVVEPEIFSPEVPPNDFIKINYHFDQSGKVANASIYDHQGRVIKVLANNEVLGVEGFFRWDGDRDDGGRARAGYYLAILQVFDIDGNVNTFRKRVVIAYR